MGIDEIRVHGVAMAAAEIRACDAWTDDDGTPLFPPEPLDEHWDRVEELAGRELTDAESTAFQESFTNVAIGAARQLGWLDLV